MNEKLECIIKTLNDALDQAQLIPTFTDTRPIKMWMTNNQRKYTIQYINDALTIAMSALNDAKRK